MALLSLSLTNDQFLAWGRRVAFALSFALVAIGIHIRWSILETPEFTALKESGSRAAVPLFTMLAEYPREILAGIGARYIDGVFFNVFAVFSITDLTRQLSVPWTEALRVVSAAAVLMCAFIPAFGALSDRIGRARTYAWGPVVTSASALPAFAICTAFPGGPAHAALAMILLLSVSYASVYGREAGLFCELFDARVRYTGISVVYQVSGIFASGLTPVHATALIRFYGVGGGNAVEAYCPFAGLVSAVSAWWIARRAARRSAAARQSSPSFSQRKFSPSAVKAARSLLSLP